MGTQRCCLEMTTVAYNDVDDNGQNQKQQHKEFIFECPIDPNNDRLEHWEQEVCSSKKQLYTFSAHMLAESMQNMIRFYNSDRIICWDLRWGLWEAIRDNDSSDSDTNDDDDSIPKMMIVNYSKYNDIANTHISFPSSIKKEEALGIVDVDVDMDVDVLLVINH
mmetsp:Transcript_1235/g.1306  ORF Transcript_1235/g.1306 Transcript_1235/m.1306 type:complete len:164 (+) Transcript_1235:53-544(+)